MWSSGEGLAAWLAGQSAVIACCKPLGQRRQHCLLLCCSLAGTLHPICSISSLHVPTCAALRCLPRLPACRYPGGCLLGRLWDVTEAVPERLFSQCGGWLLLWQGHLGAVRECGGLLLQLVVGKGID